MPFHLKKRKTLTLALQNETSMEAAKAILHQYWKYPSFRSLQEEIIQAVLEKKDVVALMPTGGGKSICFQVPALLQKGTCLVISPLIALMQDQVTELRKRGIPAAALYTGMSTQEMDIILDNCVYGKTKFLYLSPERLHTDLFRARVKNMNVPLLAIDEAHCISQWGHEFRPAYRDIAAIKSLLPEASTIALTATATQAVQQDIIQKLALRNAVILQKSFARPNLSFQVKKTEDKSDTLYQTLHQNKGSAIVYAATRKETRWIAHYLQQKGISTTYYHAGLTPDERMQRQNAWLKDAVRVIVATNAFGMGINKPNVRLVAHLHFPNTLEAFYQEAGRAGRDGQAATAITLYEGAEARQLTQKIAHAHPDAEALKATYQKLANYYQVAVGSHADVTYPFDLEDFLHTYGLQAAQVHITLQRLQEAGLIQYNDCFAQPAQIHVTTGAQQLYVFQVSNPDYHPLIKALNHCYGTHIFSDLTRFSLKRMAKYLQSSEKRIHQQLKELHDLNILTYLPQQKHATLTFLTPRYAINHLPISAHHLLERKKVMQKKAQAVIHYMTHPQRCRTQLLLEYLGEISYDKCNVCDTCTSLQQQKQPDETIYPYCREKILQLLKEKPLSPHNLLDILGAEIDQEKILNTLRVLLDKREIRYTDQLELALQAY